MPEYIPMTCQKTSRLQVLSYLHYNANALHTIRPSSAHYRFFISPCLDCSLCFFVNVHIFRMCIPHRSDIVPKPQLNPIQIHHVSKISPHLPVDIPIDLPESLQDFYKEILLKSTGIQFHHILIPIIFEEIHVPSPRKAATFSPAHFPWPGHPPPPR